MNYIPYPAPGRTPPLVTETDLKRRKNVLEYRGRPPRTPRVTLLSKYLPRFAPERQVGQICATAVEDDFGRRLYYALSTDDESTVSVWLLTLAPDTDTEADPELPPADGEQWRRVLTFHRVDSETFYRPIRLVFFKAAPTRAGGIYLFCTRRLQDGEPADKIYDCFELDERTEHAVTLTESDFYVPTLLRYGRGSCYEEALAAGSACTLPVTHPEEQNLLCGDFYAYFTTDGCSPAFQLPVDALDPAPVQVTLTLQGGSTVTWQIGENETEAAATLFGNPVTAQIDRAAGLVTFLSGAELYPLPKIATLRADNLRVWATKTRAGDLERTLGARGVLTDGDTFVFYGSDHEKDRTRCDWYTPLYLTPVPRKKYQLS